jgi:hypothetical protein
MACLAVLLGTMGSWLVVSDLLRPGLSRLALDRPSAIAAGDVTSARLAAQLGMIRGALWADAAFTDAAAFRWPERAVPVNRASGELLDRARAAMETSLSLAPINAEGWLFLARLPSASGTVDPRVASLLEMAYFTAPNAVALAPRRLERAASSGALSDPEIQDFVKTDIRRILAGKPPATAAIVAAYRGASPQNRALFEALVADVDSGFARTLHPGLQE